MSIHRELVKRMGDVESSWRRIERAQALIEGGEIRRRIFARAKERYDGLTSETRKVLPRNLPDYTVDEKPQNTVILMGGIGKISRSASNAMGMIDDVEDVFEQDVAKIDFDELERQEKRFRPYGKVLKALRWASIAIGGVGAVASLIISKVTSGPDFYSAGLKIGVGGIITAFVLGIASEKAEEFFKPGLRSIRAGIKYMRDGLVELRNSLEELLETASVFSR
jgi:hypothetical protein